MINTECTLIQSHPYIRLNECLIAYGFELASVESLAFGCVLPLGVCPWMSAESVLLEVCSEFTTGHSFPLRVSLQFGVLLVVSVLVDNITNL